MDKSRLGPLEQFCDREALLFLEQTIHYNIIKSWLGRIFSPVWDKAMTPANVKYGLNGRGIYLFNPNVIPEKTFLLILFMKTHLQQRIEPKTEYNFLHQRHLLINRVCILLPPWSTPGSFSDSSCDFSVSEDNDRNGVSVDNSSF